MKNNLPVILLKGLVLLPHQEVRLELNNPFTRKTIDYSSMAHDNYILVVCPLDQIEESPDVSDLPKVGVIGKIRTKIELPNGNLRIVITGHERVKVERYFNYPYENDILSSDVLKIELPKFKEIEEKAKIKKLKEVLAKYVQSSPSISNSIIGATREVRDLEKLTDMIASFIPFDITKKLYYMSELNPLKRAESLIHDLNVELEIISLDKKIEVELRKGLEEGQREFILKEKIKEIKKELGEEDYKEKEISEYYEILEKLDLDEKTSNKLRMEIKKYEFSSANNPETANLRNYLDTVLHLPWNNLSQDNTNLKEIRACLDKTHYGLDKVKERIVEYVAVKKRNPDLISPIICLVGPPGVGKTSLGESIASSLNKEFYKISVGGLNDSAELIGHRRTYLGANPGKIMQSIIKCGTRNPLILIDEVDKMVKDFKGDPASTLLDILDPNQNKIFIDNYIEEPFNLSNVLFILTANDADRIPVELKDRLEIINLNSYTEYEKLDITKKYLLPNILADHKVKKTEIVFKDPIILKIIKEWTRESGVRELERLLSKIVRKIITESEKKTINKTLTNNDLVKYLGKTRWNSYSPKITSPGLVNGLAWTPYGGMVIRIESCMYKGKGRIQSTGSLGEVMNESLNVALSYLKSNSKNLKYDESILKNHDFHLHALWASIKKEGPSAGVALTTSLLSLLLNKRTPPDVAMTGEITLRGEILKVGGIKEKIIGGFNEGIKKFIIPKDNMNDQEDIPQNILSKIEIIYVSKYDEIYNYLFK